MHALNSASRIPISPPVSPWLLRDDEHDEEERRDREVPDGIEERGRAQERLRPQEAETLREVGADRGAAARSRGCWNGVRIAEIAANEKAYDSASTPNGSARATANSARPPAARRSRRPRPGPAAPRRRPAARPAARPSGARRRGTRRRTCRRRLRRTRAAGSARTVLVRQTTTASAASATARTASLASMIRRRSKRSESDARRQREERRGEEARERHEPRLRRRVPSARGRAADRRSSTASCRRPTAAGPPGRGRSRGCG